MKVGWTAVDDFFDQWDPSIATPMEEVYGLQRGPCWKINLFWSDFISVSWSAYELFADPCNKPNFRPVYEA